MQSKLFDLDPVTKTRKDFRYDFTDDSFVIATKQDVTDIVEDAKGRYNLFDERTPWKGDWHHVANIPFVAFCEWLQRRYRGVSQGEAYRLFSSDNAIMKAFLNDGENGAFRTRPGTV